MAGGGHEQATGGTDVASPMALVAGVNDSIHTLVPYGDSEEEVDLFDDDVAFCLDGGIPIWWPPCVCRTSRMFVDSS